MSALRIGQILMTIPVTAGALGCGCDSATTDSPSQPTTDVRAAWTAAGVTPGWIGYGRNNRGFFPGNRGDLPKIQGFRISKWKEGILSRLPMPQESFGVWFDEKCGVTDEAIKELEILQQSLVLLEIGENSITDRGVKNIGKLMKLRTLCLDRTEVTDLGLAGLKTLIDLRVL